MKFKLLYATIFIVGLIGFCSAQNFDIKWGKPVKTNKRIRVGGIFGNDSSGYLVDRTFSSGLLGDNFETKIYRNNFDHEEKFSVNLTAALNKGVGSIFAFYAIKDNFYVFNHRINRRKKTYDLYLTIIDHKGKGSNPKLVDEIPYNIRKFSFGSFNINYIEDSGKFLIIHNEGDSRKSNEKVSYKMYNTDFDLIWEKSIELPYKSNQFTPIAYQIDEHDNIYMFGKKNTGKIAVFAYSRATQSFKESNDEIGKGANLSNLNITYSDGKLNLLGFYYESGIRGMYFSSINTQNLELVSEKFTAFAEEDMAQFKSSVLIKSTLPNSIFAQDPRHHIRQIIKKDNGDFFVLAELYSEASSSININGSISYNYYYYYEDILVTSVTKEGEINWVKNIPKKQEGDVGFSSRASYLLLEDNNKFYLIFNDLPQNLDLTKSSKNNVREKANTYSLKAIVPGLVTISKGTGEYSTEICHKIMDEVNSTFVPVRGYKVNSKKYIVFAGTEKSYRFGTLTIK